MITHHREKLDSALFRSGRCDKMIYFGLATKFVAKQMFARIMKPSSTKLAAKLDIQAGEASTGDDVLDTLYPAEIDDLAAQFAEKIPEPPEFSLADILSYLRGYVYDPREAVKEAEEWMIRLRAEMKEHEQELEREAEKRQKEHEAHLKRVKARKAEKEQARLRTIARQRQQRTRKHHKANSGERMTGGGNGSESQWGQCGRTGGGSRKARQRQGGNSNDYSSAPKNVW